MIIIVTLNNGKSVHIDGNSITTNEALEIIIKLTGTWGNDFEKAELCDMAIGIHGESRR